MRAIRGASGLAAVSMSVLVAAGCGSSSSSGASRHGHGGVLVLYAGSLVNLMEHDLGPAFARAGGYGYEGVGAGSSELVAQIESGIRHGDVFISAAPSADTSLEQAAGRPVRWYVEFARAPLVLGYDPHSAFAARLSARPWYRVLTEPGIRVGRTDPKLDPKGKLTVQAVEAAARQLHVPQLSRALSRFEVFPEESLVGRLEAGQLDAGFFYSSEASEQRIPTVPLSPVSASATYTVTVLEHAPDRKGAEAFVAYLLGAAGRAKLRAHGLTVLTPTLSGPVDSLPAALRGLVPAR